MWCSRVAHSEHVFLCALTHILSRSNLLVTQHIDLGGRQTTRCRQVPFRPAVATLAKDARKTDHLRRPYRFRALSTRHLYEKESM